MVIGDTVSDSKIIRQGNNDCEGGGELPGRIEEKKKGSQRKWKMVWSERRIYLPLFQQVNTSIGSSIFCLE